MRVAYSENIDRVHRDDARGRRVDGAGPGVGPLAARRRSRWSASSRWTDGAATIRVKFKTLPLNQGRVANELRRRLMGAFVARGDPTVFGMNGH